MHVRKKTKGCYNALYNALNWKIKLTQAFEPKKSVMKINFLGFRVVACGQIKLMNFVGHVEKYSSVVQFKDRRIAMAV